MGDDLDGLWRLPLACLEQQVAAGRQPERCCRAHPPQHVKAVRAAIERHPCLVYAGLRGKQPDFLGGDVGHVGEQHIDALQQGGGQRLVQVTFVDLALGGTDVAAGARRRGT